MANLSARNKRELEELFDMQTGWVLDFTNSTFEEFIYDVIGLRVYSDSGYEEYTSKARKLRQIWEQESDAIVGKLTYEMLERCEDLELKKKSVDAYRMKKIGGLKDVCKKLQQPNYRAVELPANTGQLQLIMADIMRSLDSNNPEFALDRLHTFAVGYIQDLCNKHNIKIKDNKGNSLPLHSLVGMIIKEYKKTSKICAEFTFIALRNSISLFDSFGEVRNNKSYAHNNDVLDGFEADYVIRIVSETLVFIDKIERLLDEKRITE